MGSQRLPTQRLATTTSSDITSSRHAAGANFMIMRRRCCAAPCLAQSPRNNWSLPQAWVFWNFTEVFLFFFLNCLFYVVQMYKTLVSKDLFDRIHIQPTGWGYWKQVEAEDNEPRNPHPKLESGGRCFWHRLKKSAEDCLMTVEQWLERAASPHGFQNSSFMR